MAMTMMTGHVGLWDFASPYDPNRVEWGGLFHDHWNTNQHGFVVPAAPAAIDPTVATHLLQLNPIRPNPGGVGRTVSFATVDVGIVQLAIHDAKGSRIRSLLETTVPAGRHTIRWDGKDDSGRRVAQGVYFARLSDGSAGYRSIRFVVVR